MLYRPGICPAGTVCVNIKPVNVPVRTFRRKFSNAGIKRGQWQADSRIAHAHKVNLGKIDVEIGSYSDCTGEIQGYRARRTSQGLIRIVQSQRDRHCLDDDGREDIQRKQNAAEESDPFAGDFTFHFVGLSLCSVRLI